MFVSILVFVYQSCIRAEENWSQNRLPLFVWLWSLYTSHVTGRKRTGIRVVCPCLFGSGLCIQVMYQGGRELESESSALVCLALVSVYQSCYRAEENWNQSRLPLFVWLWSLYTSHVSGRKRTGIRVVCPCLFGSGLCIQVMYQSGRELESESSALVCLALVFVYKSCIRAEENWNQSRLPLFVWLWSLYTSHVSERKRTGIRVVCPCLFGSGLCIQVMYQGGRELESESSALVCLALVSVYQSCYRAEENWNQSRLPLFVWLWSLYTSHVAGRKRTGIRVVCPCLFGSGLCIPVMLQGERELESESSALVCLALVSVYQSCYRAKENWNQSRLPLFVWLWSLYTSHVTGRKRTGIRVVCPCLFGSGLCIPVMLQGERELESESCLALVCVYQSCIRRKRTGVMSRLPLFVLL